MDQVLDLSLADGDSVTLTISGQHKRFIVRIGREHNREYVRVESEQIYETESTESFKTEPILDLTGSDEPERLAPVYDLDAYRGAVRD